MKKKGGNPDKKRSKDNKRKNVNEIDWQASAYLFRIMIKEGDKLIPIEIKTLESIQTYYMNETEYEINRSYYENRLDNWYNFLY